MENGRNELRGVVIIQMPGPDAERVLCSYHGEFCITIAPQHFQFVMFMY